MKLVALLAAAVLGAAADDQVCKAATDAMKAMPTCGSFFGNATDLAYLALSADRDPLFSTRTDSDVAADLDAYLAAEAAAGRTVASECSDLLASFLCTREAYACDQSTCTPRSGSDDSCAVNTPCEDFCESVVAVCGQTWNDISANFAEEDDRSVVCPIPVANTCVGTCFSRRAGRPSLL